MRRLILTLFIALSLLMCSCSGNENSVSGDGVSTSATTSLSSATETENQTASDVQSKPSYIIDFEFSVDDNTQRYELITDEYGMIIGQLNKARNEYGEHIFGCEYKVVGDVTPEKLFVVSPAQIYSVNVDGSNLTGLLPQTAYGFTKDDYLAICGKYDALYWCDGAQFNQDYSKILYASNKYEADGKPALELTIWVFDLNTNTEMRIPINDGETFYNSGYRWIEYDEFIFKTSKDSDGSIVYYIYNLSDDTLTVADKGQEAIQ